MMEVCAGSDVKVVISHMYGSPFDTHRMSMGDGYKEDIVGFLEGQISRAVDLGITDDRIIVDPGVGFGKTPEQNLAIAKDCSFLGKGHDILIGVSRKRFIRQYYPDMDVDEASAMVAKMSVDSGADIVRVHDVARAVSVLRP
jgi:dihydropteroate synthase